MNGINTNGHTNNAKMVTCHRWDTDTINILYILTLVINNIVTSCPNCDGSNMNALLAVIDSSDGCKQVRERKKMNKCTSNAKLKFFLTLNVVHQRIMIKIFDQFYHIYFNQHVQRRSWFNSMQFY